MTRVRTHLLLLSIATIPQLLHSQAIPNGNQLEVGSYCYTITAPSPQGDVPVGQTNQTIERTRFNDTPALVITVHQHMNNGHFDMKDRLIVREQNLLPFVLDTEKNGSPHAHLEYTDSAIRGWKVVNGTKQTISVSIDKPTWDGNLWGETFAALPLAVGMSTTLPVYQYDSGLGQFFIDTVSYGPTSTASGPVPVWNLKAGLSKSEQVLYQVTTKPGLEIAYTAGPASQHLGGDCSGFK